MPSAEETLSDLCSKYPAAERILTAMTMGHKRTILELQQNNSRLWYMLSTLRSCMRYDEKEGVWVISRVELASKDRFGLLTNVV